VFFSVAHDPTQLNRQGRTWARSTLGNFLRRASQKQVAEAYITQLDGARVFPRRIVTRVDPLKGFYAAEAYHQDYLLNHPGQPYIAINDLPKVRNFERLLPQLYNAKPVTVASQPRRALVPESLDPTDPPAQNQAMSGGAAASAASHDAPAGAPSHDAPAGAMMSANVSGGAPKVEGDMPELAGATAWLNSKPLTRASLRGKVVVLDFWTYSCINCLRALPYVNAWYQHYKDSGLVIIGVHSPEFEFEKDTANVRQADRKFGIQYPVALDSNMALWKAVQQPLLAAHYFVDAQGRIRGHHFGEGKYARSGAHHPPAARPRPGAKNLPDPLD
jgi:thiol-disulfide isomerase/thioredoxin